MGAIITILWLLGILIHGVATFYLVDEYGYDRYYNDRTKGHIVLHTLFVFIPIVSIWSLRYKMNKEFSISKWLKEKP